MQRFLLGFAVGAAIGAAAVLLTNPRRSETARDGIGDLLRNALEAAKQASATQEQTMWAEYRQRIAAAPAEQRPQLPGGA